MVRSKHRRTYGLARFLALNRKREVKRRSPADGFVALPLSRNLPFFPSLKTLNEWSLVLEAVAIPHRLETNGLLPKILVQPNRISEARYHLTAYVRENREQEKLKEAVPTTIPLFAPGWHLAPLLALLIFYPITTLDLLNWGFSPETWLDIGSAQALAVAHGQWWRLMTALSLHADPAHLLSNVAIGWLFLGLARIGLGPGMSALLTILAGTLGNAINAFFLGQPHDSIGFSTAVFGAAGLVVGIRLVPTLRRNAPSAFMPLAAGLAFLAALGTGGEHTDLGAHLFGLIAGIPLGFFPALILNRQPLPLPWDRLCAGLSIFLPVIAWFRAFQ